MTATPTRGILFADLANSSRLYRELGDTQARNLVLSALELAQSVVERERGRVVDRIGDELFCVFDDGDAALRAAVGIQEETDQARDAGRLPAVLAFRIGFVHGPVGLRDTEVFGDSVYLAKRVANFAKADQVLTSGETLAALQQTTPDRFLAVDRVRLKGRVEEVEVFEALWGERGTIKIDLPARSHSRTERELHLTFANSTTTVSKERPDVALGRSPACELIIDEARVSRCHARVELAPDGFVLIDQSRNGTVIRRDGADPQVVVRARAVLEGAGTLQLGADDQGAPLVSYIVRPHSR